jgi:hypothetical protein
MTHPEQTAAHTPGPWSWKIEPQAYPESDDADLPAVVRSANGKEVVTIYERYCTDGDYEANARLIAAAPDLLDALKRLESTARILPESMDEPGSAMSQARAAISRAEGRTEPKAGE